MKDGCPFCDYAGPSPILAEYGAAIVFEPLNPVVEGHVLVVPRAHAEDFADSPEIAEVTMRAASQHVREYAPGDCNLITSRGPAATQTVPHLHLHILPRREGDGLALPWT